MSRSAWVIGIAVALVLILLVGTGLIASGGWGRGYGQGYGWGMMGPGMMGVPFMGPIFGLVLICLFIGGVVWFVQSRSGEPPRPESGRPATETPLEILKRRYASGEVTKKQFDEMRRTLDS